MPGSESIEKRVIRIDENVKLIKEWIVGTKKRIRALELTVVAIVVTLLYLGGPRALAFFIN